MAFQKGNKKIGGRQKGTKNVRTVFVEQIAAKYEYDPFEVLIMIAAGDWKGLGYDNECYVMEGPSGATKIGYTITPEMRLQAAKEATQYLHAKKKEQPEVSNEIEIYSIEDKKKFIEQCEKELDQYRKELDESTTGPSKALLKEKI